MCFDASVFGIETPQLPSNCSMVMEILLDNEGKVIEQRQYAVPRLGFWGQGFPLTTYKPTAPERREKLVAWTCTPVFKQRAPAVAEIIQRTSEDKARFPF